MKKVFSLLVAVALAFGLQAQDKVYVHSKGVAYEFNVDEIEAIDFVQGSDVNGVAQPKWVSQMEFVDLGLSVQWATCNLGAESPEEFGFYYGWGMTTPYSEGEVSWENYFKKMGGTGTDAADCGTEADPLKEYLADGSLQDETIATTAFDAATAANGQWRLPTLGELYELVNDCGNKFYNGTQSEFGGAVGYKLYNKEDESKFIFIPTAGVLTEEGLVRGKGEAVIGLSYWSADCYSDNEKAWSIDMEIDEEYMLLRYLGRTIRPVKGPINRTPIME